MIVPTFCVGTIGNLESGAGPCRSALGREAALLTTDLCRLYLPFAGKRAPTSGNGVNQIGV